MPVYGKDFTYTGEYLLIDDNDNNWRIKFLTSGTFIPLTAMCIDVFLVGGGGGGARCNVNNAVSWSGGGGGYTKTVTSLVLAKDLEYPLVIGNGGQGSYINDRYIRASSGGSSSAFNISVDGGEGAGYRHGGNGGSGGGFSSSSSSSNYGIDGNSSSNTGYGGVGQGTTTREFGESTGDLYASGGSSGDSPDGSPNTGDGGASECAGGSGIIIIRNHRT